MILLTVNSGSTSTKLAAFAFAGDVLSPIARESHPGGAGRPGDTLADFARRFDSLDVAAVAHRVVHGGHASRSRRWSTPKSNPRSRPFPRWRHCTIRPRSNGLPPPANVSRPP